MANSQDFIIDSSEFARQGKSLEGTLAFESLLRATEDTELVLPKDKAGHDVLLHWSVQGSSDKLGRLYLTLKVRVDPVLICQRCGEPFVFHIDNTSVLELVASEAELGDDSIESIWEEAQSEAHQDFFSDKILTGSKFNLLDLIEDEVILALPYVPKHDHCDGQSSFESDDTETSPFAVLAKLKQH